MDQVYRVPVKSLVAIEGEDDEEDEKECDQEEYANGHISESDTDSTSSSEAYSYSDSSSTAPTVSGVSIMVKNCLEGSLYHLFLPKKIPDCAQPDLADIELWILQNVSDTFQDVLSYPKLLPISKMFASWKFTQPKGTFDRSRFAARFLHEINNMENEDTVPIYVKKQNATILFTKQDAGNGESRMKVETFRPSLPSETIMSTVGSLQVTFPETSNFIYNTNLLCSEMFAKQLHELAVEEFEASMSTSTKADKGYLEHREVPDPLLVSDWIVALLCPTSQYQSDEIKISVTKKIRDEVNCQRSAHAIPFRRSGLWTSIKVALHLKLLQMTRNENDARIIYKCLLLRILSNITQMYESSDKNANLDLLSQLLAKLGRRVRKLQKMGCDKKSDFADEILYLWSSTLKFVHSVVSSISQKMNATWIHNCFPANDGDIPLISRTKEEFKKDLLHDIPWLNGIIAKKGSNPLVASLKAATGRSDKHQRKTKGTPPKSAPGRPTFLSGSKESLQEKFERYHTYESIMTHKGDIRKLVQLKVWRFDTENFVKFQTDECPSLQDNAKAVIDLLLTYVTATTQPYFMKDNPLGFSQTILVSLKLVQLLDQIATKRHPLLLQYKTGITRNLFDKLLLPHRDDMELLDKILSYFKERDQNAQFSRGGVLDSVLGDISPTAFTCRFASSSEEMISLRGKILEDIQLHISDKLKQVDKIREECGKMQSEIEEKEKSCEDCNLKSEHLEIPEGQDDEETEVKMGLEGSRKCKECFKLEEELEKKRFSVPVYERPLPTEEHLQYAVIFELRIPDEIKLLREGLALLKFDLLREQQSKIDGASAKIKWNDYKSLLSYRTSEKTKIVKSGKSEGDHVALCSRLLSTSSTHHTRIKNPDVLNLNTKSEESSPFIVPNGMDCVYHYIRRNYLGHESVNLNKLCTFQIGKPSQNEEEDKDNPYASMQWAVDGTTHSQNRVIAEYSSTYHPELLAFGSLRAGHRIQLMNMYRYIANRQLQLEKEPVAALILQTLWEVGPSSQQSEEKCEEREAHVDFMDDEFTEEFLEMLEKLVEMNDTNYSNPVILLNIIVITGRILEMNENWRKRCRSLLRKCRMCADTWLEMIQNEMSKKGEGNRSLSPEEEKMEKRLIKMQLEISICSALSYNFSSEDLFEFAIEDAQDLLQWFQTLCRLHELSRESGDKSGKGGLLSSFGKQLLNMARQIPLKLNLEGRLVSSPAFKDLFVKCLHVFSCQKWDWAAGAARWELLVEDSTSSNNVVVGQYPTDMITFDLLQGTFLVNGFSRSGIPLCILENPFFEMYFHGQTSKLKVVQSQSVSQQESGQQQISVLFRTTDKFHGKHYEFEMFPKSKLSIREIDEETGTKLELLIPDKFQGIFGDELVYTYSHWLDHTKNIVYFRRLPLQDSDYNLPAEFTLRLDSSTTMWLLKDELHQAYYTSRKSHGFKVISKALSRLELARYVNVFLTDDDNQEGSYHVTVRLPRLHLTFNLENGYLVSKEYENLKLSSSQSEKGTLIGLEHGLLLDNLHMDNAKSSDAMRPVRRIILVPHGKLNVQAKSNPCYDRHQTTQIDLNHLRQPPFFSYEFDSVLKRLKGDKSKSAWLYLAALHAATSSCSPSLLDPFTQMTGTEMAIQILQSGFVWSCSPFDEESLSTLRMIRRFAPVRQYYGHGLNSPLRSPRKGMKDRVEVPLHSENEQMETTEWPPGLPSMVAYDGLAIIVGKLLEDSERLSVMHPKQSHRGEGISLVDRIDMSLEKLNLKSSPKLQARAYYRHIGAYNKASILQPEFFLKSAQIFNENAVLPELLIHKRKMVKESDEVDEKTEHLNLAMLLRISQARFVSTLEDPVVGSHRKSDIASYLLTASADANVKEEILLPALPLPDCTSGIPLKHLLGCNFKENWLKFYQMAVTWANSEEGKHAFSLVLAALAYQGCPIAQLLNLHNISVLAETINFPMMDDEMAKVTFSDHCTENDFSEVKLKQFLIERAHARKDRQDHVERVFVQGQVRVIKRGNTEADFKLKTYEGQLEVENKIDKFVKEVKELWPCSRVPREMTDDFYIECEKVLVHHDFKLMQLKISKWYRNWQLKNFIQNVEGYLDKFYEHFPNIPKHNKKFDLMTETKLNLLLSRPLHEDNPYEHTAGLTLEGELDEAGVIFFSGSAFQESNVELLIPTQKEECRQKIENYSSQIKQSVGGGSSKQVVLMAGLAPRTSPGQLLKYLLYGLRSGPGNVSPSLLKAVGALAVLWTELKRFNRILALMGKKETAAVELKAELENGGHENWSPVDYPEWLVLELELDIMIRPIQVDVAKQMMKMPEGKNGVMQLNMGEGKTSVIVPMLCCALSQEPETLCRVTVLHSIFKTNLNLLSFAIGGQILSRRVYTFPCRRDTELELGTLDKIKESYAECLKLKGVVLTLPEYRLSFRLLPLDKTLKGYPEVGVKFLDIENGLRKYCRDILDESDELLNVKYQLVYTTGSQIPADGGSLRWIACQKVLQIVQDVAWVFLGKMGSSAVEFDNEQQNRYPEQFAYFRLLNQGVEAMEEFCCLIADEFLKELKLTERQKQIAKKVLTQEKISEENFKFVMGLFKNDQSQLDEIRLLTGYLKLGILGLALSKRWRVEYGVDPNGKGRQYRRMAVPFRAKDCPSEKTEFGHPDLAIILTHLSYYYSGLSDKELEECIITLKLKPEAEMIYSSWVGRLSNVPRFLASYSGVNMEDAYQRSNLFSMLRKHKGVVDFWLSHKVFPAECKQFPGKISMSAWDLCYERQRLPMTGFSGTNDSSVLLPLPVSQQDLKELLDTNKKMERVLLQSENGNHKGFQIGVTCKEILDGVKKESGKVLIDAGALMLELDNEEVAQLWLEIDPELEAVIYFSKESEMVVKFRTEHNEAELDSTVHQKRRRRSRGSFHRSPPLKKSSENVQDTPIELSPYRNRLDKCGVFLDDQHSRGTDLKFPVGSKAIVTIGSRMRRDKLMQACMRMRLLGIGHSVTFFLSHEASTKVKESGKIGEISTESVLKWVARNTEEYNNEGLLYWAIEGKNYAQKLAAQEFHDTVDTHPLEKIYTLARQCVEEEVTSLKDMYGTYTEAELLAKLIPQWFEKGQRKLQTVEGCYSLSQRITRRYDGLRDAIKTRIMECTPDKMYLSGGLHAMEEEQEKEIEAEMEMETEEERQIIRPIKMDYETATLHDNVKKAVLQGEKITEKAGIIRLAQIFEKTSFWKLVQPECWAGSEVYVTNDFASVVKPNEKDEPSQFKTDAHLRPVEYIVSIRSKPQATASSTLSFKKAGSSPPRPMPLQILILSPFEVNELLPHFRSGKAQCQLHMFSARHFQAQSLLCNTASLQVPRPFTLQSQNAPVLLHMIPDESKCLAAILIASGNLYFASMEEQKSFAKFLGLVPRPWSAEQMNAFEKEMIKKTGFLLPKFRKQQMDCCQIEQGAFQKDPIPLVRKILACRHAVVTDVAHVSRLLNRNWLVDLS